jgi:hypothetical protein
MLHHALPEQFVLSFAVNLFHLEHEELGLCVQFPLFLGFLLEVHPKFMGQGIGKRLDFLLDT